MRLLCIILILFLLTGMGQAVSAGEASAPLGSVDHLGQFVSWLCALGEELIAIFRDIMEMLGLSNETYAIDMVDTLECGMMLINSSPQSIPIEET